MKTSQIHKLIANISNFTQTTEILKIYHRKTETYK